MRESKPGVLTLSGPVVTVARDAIAALKRAARRAPRRRARLCAHPDNRNPIHEMLIALDRQSYVRPHRHPGKSESFHVVAGRADVVLFGASGVIERVIRLGDYRSGLAFYYRISDARYHTLVVRSPVLVIHETTNGPFRRADCRFAPWAPGDDRPDLWPDQVADLKRQVRAWQASRRPRGARPGPRPGRRSAVR